MERIAMADRNTVIYAVATVLAVIFLIGVVFYMFWSDIRTEKELAPDFELTMPDGNLTTLRELSGSPILLHITNIENPICMECEKELKEQVLELQKAKESEPELTIITINMRKNIYSEPGYQLVKEWWGTNVSWTWIEDPEPFRIAGDYIEYWSIGSESANPTLLLLDQEQYVVGIYHIYQMGKGKVYGVMTSEKLNEKVEKVSSGDWEGVEGQKSAVGTGSVGGMFVLGIITSFSPCSIALLFTVFTFILSSRVKGKGPSVGPIKGISPKEGLIIGVSFVFGMALVFFILGLFIANLGVFLHGARFFDLAAGALLVVLGLNNIFSLTEVLSDLKGKLFRSKAESEVKEEEGSRSLKERSIERIKGVFTRSPALGAFLLGVFFSLGWAPCAVSLVLPVVVWILSQDVSTLMGGLLFFVFGIGHGLIFIPLAVGTSSFSGKMTQRFVSAGKWVKIVFGAIVIIMGIIFALRFFGIKLW